VCASRGVLAVSGTVLRTALPPRFGLCSNDLFWMRLRTVEGSAFWAGFGESHCDTKKQVYSQPRDGQSQIGEGMKQGRTETSWVESSMGAQVGFVRLECYLSHSTGVAWSFRGDRGNPLRLFDNELLATALYFVPILSNPASEQRSHQIAWTSTQLRSNEVDVLYIVIVEQGYFSDHFEQGTILAYQELSSWSSRIKSFGAGRRCWSLLQGNWSPDASCMRCIPRQNCCLVSEQQTTRLWASVTPVPSSVFLPHQAAFTHPTQPRKISRSLFWSSCPPRQSFLSQVPFLARRVKPSTTSLLSSTIDSLFGTLRCVPNAKTPSTIRAQKELRDRHRPCSCMFALTIKPPWRRNGPTQGPVVFRGFHDCQSLGRLQSEPRRQERA
jgi:hypothetical protein